MSKIFIVFICFLFSAVPVIFAVDTAGQQVVMLKDIKPPAGFNRKGTVYDYLSGIEAELLAFERDNLLPGKISSSEKYYFKDCLDIAIGNHLPLEIAKDKISLHKRKLIKAVRDMLPGMTVFYEHDRGFKILKADTNPGDHSNQQFRSEKWRMSFFQPVFRGGTLFNKVRKERALLRAAEAEYNKVLLDLAVEVARAYFNYSKAKTMLSFREDLLAKAKKSLEISQEKMDAQLISEIEHLNVQSQESQIEHDLEVAKEDIALALIDLQKALHIDVELPIDVVLLDGKYSDVIKDELEKKEKEGAVNEEKQEEKINELVKTAYEKRPEFIINKSKLDAAVYEVKAAAGGWFPQATGRFEIGQKAEAYIEDDNNPAWDEEHRIVFDTSWNLMGNTLRYTYDKNRQGTGVEAIDPGNLGMDGYYDRINRVSVSVLDNLDQFIKTKEAEINRKEAMLELELSEKDIVSEVKEAYYNYNRALIQLKSTHKKLSYRKKLVSLAKHRSEINEIQLSEYLQAEMDLINERETLYKAMVDFFLAKISLNKAVGIKNYSLLDLKTKEQIR